MHLFRGAIQGLESDISGHVSLEKDLEWFAFVTHHGVFEEDLERRMEYR